MIPILKLGFDLTKILFLRERENYDRTIVDPIWFSVLAQIAGIDVLIIQLQPNFNLSQKEFTLIRDISKVPINLKVSFLPDYLQKLEEFNPDIVTFYSRKGVYTSLELEELFLLQEEIEKLQKSGKKVCVFLEPETDLIREAIKKKVDFIELDVKNFFTTTGIEQQKEYDRILKAARFASTMRSRIIIGHGVNYQSLTKLLNLPALEEIHVGRSIISRALLVGLNQAIKEMMDIIKFKTLK